MRKFYTFSASSMIGSLGIIALLLTLSAFENPNTQHQEGFLKAKFFQLSNHLQQLIDSPEHRHSKASSLQGMMVPCVGMSGEIGGKAFGDFNYDGLDNQTGYLPDIQVFIYGCDVGGNGILIDSTTTDSLGNYRFIGLSDGTTYRLEFMVPDHLPEYSGGFGGSDNSTDIQFVTSPVCNAHVAFSHREDYCGSENPTVAATCFINGNALPMGAEGHDEDVLVSFKWNYTNASPTPDQIASAGEIGATFGLAYHKASKKLYTSAFLKRHVGVGPLGLGGLYEVDYTDPNNPILNEFLDVETIGIDVGHIESNVDRGLPVVLDDPSNDSTAYSKIGRQGIGGLSVSEDGKLWFVNLHDKKLYSIDIDADSNPATAPTVGDVTMFTIPTNGCTGGEFRPFAVSIFRGEVYVGGVCDAFTSQLKSNLSATIYKLSGGAFTQVVSFSLDYEKGDAATADMCENYSGWYPWSDVLPPMCATEFFVYPQPILSEFNFDIDGSIIIGFMDRAGHQLGYKNWPLSGSMPLMTNVSGGDILRVYNNNGVYEIENNGTAGNLTTAGVGNMEGPGGGEFYFQDFFEGPGDNIPTPPHSETSQGGMTFFPGSGKVATTALDPYSTQFNSGGINWFTNTTGEVQAEGYILYLSTSSSISTFAKANGLGGLEVLCEDNAPLEIGNYIWHDENSNGIQDACEPALVGINVSLYSTSGMLLATVQTDAKGQYFFNKNTPGLGTLATQTTYYVVAGTGGQFNTGTNQLNSLYYLTLHDVGDGHNPDKTDSDGQIAGNIASGAFAGLPYIEVTTGDKGWVDHSIDFGFSSLNVNPIAGIGDFVWNDTDKNGIQNGGESGIEGVTVKLFDTTDLLLDSTITDNFGTYFFPSVPAGTYYLTFDANTNTAGILNFEGSPKNQGNGTNDSDPNPMTGKTDDIVFDPANGNNNDIDAGFFTPAGSIGGYVWEDINENGIQGGGEPPIEGVMVILIDANLATPLDTVFTDATGNYVFTGVDAGNYVVSFDVDTNVAGVPNYQGSPQSQGNGANDSDPHPVNGQTPLFSFDPANGNNNEIDAGFYQPTANLGGLVWLDDNMNGIQDIGEGGLGGVTVYLIDTFMGDTVATTNTNLSGGYIFPGVTTGTGAYVIAFNEMTNTPAIPNLIGSPQNQGDGTNDSDANPATGQTTPFIFDPLLGDDLEFDAGFYELLSSIAGFVWNDLDEDGVQDGGGEVGIENATVRLIDANTGMTVATQMTDNNGMYIFNNVPLGDYVIEFDATTNSDGLTNLESSPQNIGSDLTDSDANPATGQTAIFSFDPANGSLMNIDAGVYEITADISGYVWHDLNENGIQNGGELGIYNVEVQLINAGTGGTIATTFTNAGGLYTFMNIELGNYIVEFDATTNMDGLTNLQGSMQNVGNGTNDSDPHPLTGQTNAFLFDPSNGDMDDVDAGFFEAPILFATVGNFVFKDCNANGLQDLGEEGIPNVTVTIVNDMGYFASTSTDINGFYEFNNLLTGNYMVQFFLPASPTGLAFSPQHVGMNQAIDSDANMINGESHYFSLFGGDNKDDVDAGMIDVAPPYFINPPGDVVVPCDDPMMTTPPTLVALDNCDDDVMVTFHEQMGGMGVCNGGLTVTRIWTATDDCGNTHVHTQVISTSDDEAPYIIGIPDLSVECDSNIMLTPKAVDDCDTDPDLTYQDSLVVGECPIFIVRKWTATDDCGNVTTNTQKLTIDDTTPPEVKPTHPFLLGAQNNEIVTIDCHLPCDFDENSAMVTDNCDASPEVDFMQMVLPGDCVADGFIKFIMLRWTATDNCDNQTIFTVTVIVKDLTAPEVVSAPPSITVDCNQVPPAGTASFTDNCDNDLEINFNETIIGDTCGDYKLFRTWTAMDDCGNMGMAQQVIEVLGEDDLVLLGVPTDLTIDCTDPIPNPAMPTHNQECLHVDIEFEELLVGDTCSDYKIIRKWTAMNGCGEMDMQQQLISVNVDSLFLTGIPADITIDCDDPIPAPANPTANDECFEVTIEFEEMLVGDTCTAYKIIRKWTATDDCGNMVMGDQLISVLVPDLMLVGVPDDLTIDCDDMVPPPAMPMANHDCVAVDIELDETVVGDTCSDYKIIRKWTATDVCGNMMMDQQLITVSVPELMLEGVPADITIECTDPVPPPAMPMANHDCVEVEIMMDEAIIGDTCTNYKIIRIWMAMNTCGDMVMEQQLISVLVPPLELMGVPDDLTIDCDDAVPPPANPTANDECYDVTIEFDETIVGDTCSDYKIIRLWTATDDCGNVITEEQLITVQVEELMLVGVPADITISCSDPIPTPVDPVVNEACYEVMVEFEETVLGDTCSDYKIIRKWTATDDCGNMVMDDQIISVEFEALMLENVPADLTIDCTDPLPDPAQPMANNECVDVNIQFMETVVGDTCHDYKIIRKWTATDDCGNMTMAQHLITVLMVDSLQITGVPADITIDCNDPIPAPADPMAEQECVDADIMYSEINLGGTCVSKLIRTWKATNDCGDMISESQVITIEDQSAPDIEFNHPLLVNLDDGDTIMFTCDQLVNFGISDVTATDACDDDVEVQFMEMTEVGDCINTGVLVTLQCCWKAFDDCGNQSQLCIFVVIKDESGPTLLNVPADLTVNLALGETVPDLMNVVTAIDDCDDDVDVQFMEMQAAGPDGCGYILTCTWKAYDDCGHETIETMMVTVEDICDCPDILVDNYQVSPADCGMNNGSISVNMALSPFLFEYDLLPDLGNTSGAGNVITDLPYGSYVLLITYPDSTDCEEKIFFDVGQINCQDTMDVLIFNEPTTVCIDPSLLNYNGPITSAAICDSGNASTAQITALNNDCIEITPDPNFIGTSPDLLCVVLCYNGSNVLCDTTYFRVTIEPAPKVCELEITNIQGLDPSCDNNDGSIDLTVIGSMGATNYIWSPDVSSSNIATNLPEGIYHITIEDVDADCSIDTTITLTAPPLATLELSDVVIENIICPGGLTGSITSLTANQYAVSNLGGFIGMTPQANLPADIYTLDYTNGSCLATLQVEITEPDDWNVETTITPASCIGNDGAISVNVTGGTGGYTYTWSPNVSNSNEATGLAGNALYHVTIEDSEGCQSFLFSTNLEVEEDCSDCNLGISIVQQTADTCNASTGSIELAVTGAQGNITYEWLPLVSIDNVAQGLTAGNYRVIATDENDCKDTLEFTINAQSNDWQAEAIVTPTECGGSTGAIILDITNDPGDLTYFWIPGVSTGSGANGLSAGTYDITVTDGNGCNQNLSVEVESEMPIWSVSASKIDESCVGGDGEIALTITNDPGNLTYTWLPGVSTGTGAVGLSAGMYLVTITDGNTCEQIVEIEIGGGAQTWSVTPSSTDENCESSNGSIALSITNDPGTLTYNWLPNVSDTASADNLSAGFYSVTIQDDAGCLSVQVIQIEDIAQNWSLEIITNHETCAGDDGSIFLDISNNPGNLIYTWSPAVSSSDGAFGLASGIYEVTISDANGCAEMHTIEILGATKDWLTTVSGTNESCLGNDGNIILNVVNDPGNLTYNWWPVVSDSASANNLIAGTYSVTITDTLGCSEVQEVDIQFVAQNWSVEANVTHATCDANDGIISLTVTNDPNTLTYAWSPNVSTGTQASNLAAGFYQIIVTDVVGCVDTLSVEVQGATRTWSIGAAVSAAHCGQSNGSIFVTLPGVPGGYTFDWSPNVSSSNSANNLAAGTYNLTVTDPFGCTETRSFNLGNNGQAWSSQVVSTDESCSLGNGSIMLNITDDPGNLTYAWSPNVSTTNLADSLSAGTYSVTITDTMNCETTHVVNIQNLPQSWSATPTVSDENCGASNGSILLNVVNDPGDLTYTWSPVVSSSNLANNLTAGLYSVSISDPSGCSEVHTITVETTGQNWSVSVDTTHESCSESNGSIVLNITNDPGNLSYAWSPNASMDNVADSLSAGTYSVTITDTLGCMVVEVIDIQNTDKNWTVGVDAIDAQCLTANGSITLNVMNDPGNLTYTWSPNVSNTNAADSLAAGTYAVTITDLAGCFETKSIDLQSLPPAWDVMVTSQHASCAADDGSIHLQVTDSPGNLIFDWSPDVSSDTLATNLSAGIYGVTITDTLGCVRVLTTEITQPTTPTWMVNNVITNETCTGNDGALELQITGGNGPLTYAWTPDVSSTNSATGLVATDTFDILVTDSLGCILQLIDLSVGLDCNPDSVTKDTIATTIVCGDTTAVLCVSLAQLPGAFDTLTVCQAPGFGTLTIENDTCLLYTVNTGYIGSDSLCLITCDSFGICDTTIFDLTIEECFQPSPCEDAVNDAYIITPVNDCTELGAVCLDIALDEIIAYTITDNGAAYQNGVGGCRNDTTFYFSYISIPSSGAAGPYQVISWTVDGASFAGNFNNINDLLALMNMWDPDGFWEADANGENLVGGNPQSDYSGMLISQTATGALANLELNINLIPAGSEIYLSAGIHELIFDENGTFCEDTVTVEVVCLPSDLIRDTIFVNESKSQCLDLAELPGNVMASWVNCPSCTKVNFSIDNNCVTYLGIQAGTDLATAVVCDDFGLCDTTYFEITVVTAATQPLARIDVDTTEMNTAVNVNVLANDELNGDMNTQDITRAAEYGDAAINLDGSVTYVPSEDFCGLDALAYNICNQVGCDTATVNILVRCDTPRPMTGFSPNGDGINETFVIVGADQFANTALSVFNRWGELVYKQVDYQNDWRGTYDAKDLPDGTYFYVFAFGEDRRISGFVQVGR